MRQICFPLFVIAVALALLPPDGDAAQGKKLRLAFSAIAYDNPPFWIAHDLKLPGHEHLINRIRE